MNKPIEEMTDEEWNEWLGEAIIAQQEYEYAKQHFLTDMFGDNND